MKRSLSILIIAMLSLTVLGQKLVLTRDVNATTKNRITALKVTIDVYGDSIANQIFLGNVRIPGPLFVVFNNKLDFDSLRMERLWNSCEKDFVEKVKNSISKQKIYLYSYELFSLPNDKLLTAYEEGIIFCLLADAYEPLASKAKYFRNHENPEGYQFIDYVKELIEKWDKVAIKDIYGNSFY